MHVASRELCSELHKLSGWYDVDMFYVKSFTKKDEYKNSLWELENYSDYSEHMTKKEFSESNTAPAYDLGYLLRKLQPAFNKMDKKTLSMNTIQICMWSIPEDRAAELAIELFKQGVLKRED